MILDVIMITINKLPSLRHMHYHYLVLLKLYHHYLYQVPGCYFPLRENCRVELYQDAEHTAQPEHEAITTGKYNLDVGILHNYDIITGSFN